MTPRELPRLRFVIVRERRRGHPCLDCPTIIQGQAKRCPDCKHLRQRTNFKAWRDRQSGPLRSARA